MARLAPTPHALAVLCCATALTVQAEHAESAKRTFNLPSGDAATTLKLFAAAAGTPIVYLVDSVRGTKTNAVAGDFAPRDALEKMLAGSALEVFEDAVAGGFVVRRKPAPEGASERSGGEGRNAQQQNKPMPITSPPRSLIAAFAAWLAVAGSSIAQPQPGDQATQQENVLTLNPFTVSAERELGYAANSTLAGTRLNTSLRDVAAAVTVITPEFMADLGTFTLQETLSHTVNAEFNPSGFNSANNTVASARVRGVRIDGNTQDFFTLRLPLDIYNLEQISINRGPNSLLFGVGNPAGTLTGVSKRATFTDRYEAMASFDRWDGWRGTLDANKVLIPNRLALRVAALRRDSRYFVTPAYWKEDRIYVAGTAELATRRNWRTTLRFNAERADADRLLPNLRTPNETITPWLENNSPTVAGVRPAANPSTLPRGLVRDFGANQLVLIDGGSNSIPLLNWIHTARGGVTGAEVRALDADHPLPYDRNYNGPTRTSDYAGNNYTVFLEQELGENTFVELAYGESKRDLDWVRSLGGDSIEVDGNETLPNGQPNPNVGKFFTQGVNRIQFQREVSRQLRLTAAHTLDLRRTSEWLGQHRFGALLSREYSQFALDDLYETNGTPLPGYPQGINHVQNRIVRRSYLSPEGHDVWQRGYTFASVPSIQFDGVNSRYYNERPLRNDSRVESLVLAVQSKTLKDRLATTLGYRWDRLKSYALDQAGVVRAANGELPSWKDIPLTSEPENTLRNGTFTAGAVLHVLPQLSIQANRSETSDVAPGQLDINGRPVPTPTGHGEDYGIKFSLLRDRLTGSLTRYKSSQDNQLNSNLQNLGPLISQMGTTLGLPALAEVIADPRDTQDIKAEGYEFELIFNPSSRWRFALNASRNDNVLTNVNVRTARFLDENVYPLEAEYGTRALPNGKTVAEEIAFFRQRILNAKTAAEGRRAEALREYNVNVLTNYRFDDGRLKGFSIGGNLQYRGPAVIGARVDPITNVPDHSNPIMGNSYTLVGLHLRYERRLMDRYNWQIGLHIRNLFDVGPFIEKTASAVDGSITGREIQEPRNWMLTTGLEF